MSQTPPDPYRPPDPQGPPPGYGSPLPPPADLGAPPPASGGYGAPPPPYGAPPPAPGGYGAPPPPYGAPPPAPGSGYPAPGGYPSQPRNGLAIAGLVLGIASVAVFFIPFVGLLLAVVGGILSIVGWTRSDRIGAGKGLAVGGLVASVVGLLIGIVWIVFFVWLLDEGMTIYEECDRPGITQQERDRCVEQRLQDQFGG